MEPSVHVLCITQVYQEKAREDDTKPLIIRKCARRLPSPAVMRVYPARRIYPVIQHRVLHLPSSFA